MSKIKGKQSKLHDPFDKTAYKTERSGVGVLMHWMRNIIEKEHIDLGLPDVDTSGTDRKSPDTVIYENRRSGKVLCVIEAKLPFYNVYNEEGLKNPAHGKAVKRKAKFYATTNFKKILLYETSKTTALAPEEDQILDTFNLSAIEDIRNLDQFAYSEPTKKGLGLFLKQIYGLHKGVEQPAKHPLDERLVSRMHETVRVLAANYSDIVQDKYHKEPEFRKDVKKWFNDQNWSFSDEPKYYDRIARQTAYLLVNKILFYDLLQAKRPGDLDPLEIPQGLTKGSMLEATLQGYFREVLKIDFETIYTTDFIDHLAFPDSKQIVQEIKGLISILKRYDFSKLGYDIIGRILEKLIPPEERHNLGQYFTRSDVVDLILRFCSKHEDDKILDPSCGTGTFLKRAYQQKKLLNERKSHEDILERLWGNDIAKFPATLAIINLAINDLGAEKNWPNIIQEDFFALSIESDGFRADKWRRKRAKTLGIKEREVIYPRLFDAVVGNPPYTRQEEIAEIAPKDSIIRNALNLDGKPIAKINKRAGIHAYFFIHGSKLLKEGGRFGFIVSNSWLDVDYGKGLQEFFLNNYKIIAIIESKVERWFADADINTCIVILEKCKDPVARENNPVRFVYLKKELSEFVPPAGDNREEELRRSREIDKLIDTILSHDKLYQNDELRIFPIRQNELWEEGFDEEGHKFVGAKWGKYLRAPEIYFSILNSAGLTKLCTLAHIQRGFTTGANEFFYLSENKISQLKLDDKYWKHKDKAGHHIPNYVIKSPKELKGITINPVGLKYRVLLIHDNKNDLKGRSILRYIKMGEVKAINERETCSVREKWYELNEVSGNIILVKGIWNRHFVGYSELSIFIDQQLYVCKLKDVKYNELIAAILNSTYIALFNELIGRTNFGEGILWIARYELLQLLVPKPELLSKDIIKRIIEIFNVMKKRTMGTIFEELGADKIDDFRLDKIKPDRRDLDKIIMGDIIGLTEDDQLQIYHSIIDLVKTRIEKAKSAENDNENSDLDIDAFSKNLIEGIKVDS